MTNKVKPKEVIKKPTKKKIVLFVGFRKPQEIHNWIDENNLPYRVFSILSKKTKKERLKKAGEAFNEILLCDFADDNSISEALLPYRKNIVAITARGEANSTRLRKCLPHLPYINTPTESSILWATDKIEMRQRMHSFDANIVPDFVLIKGNNSETVASIEKRLDYPVMVKPSGLASSMLVTNCYHRDELETALSRVYKQANIFHRIYKEFYKEDTPQVLVEELMEGEMYSVDGVVNGKGKVISYPPVHVKTGKQIGFDDYFGYQRITPSRLGNKSIREVEKVTKRAVHAVGLRYSSFHLELLRTEEGWKVIEIAPRIGGFRQEMYKLSYNIDLMLNDINNKLNKEITVPKSSLGYTAVLQMFAKKEGYIKRITGIKVINNIVSIHEVKQHKKVGDRVKFAKNGGGSVLDITLHNVSRPELLADIRRVEQTLKIIVK